MFIAYKLDLKSEPSDSSQYTENEQVAPQELLLNSEIAELVKAGENYVDECEKPIKKAIGEYLNMDGTIDASKLEDDWFPELQNIQSRFYPTTSSDTSKNNEASTEK